MLFIIKSQIVIRLSDIDHAREFLKKSICNSQIFLINKLCLSILESKSKNNFTY